MKLIVETDRELVESFLDAAWNGDVTTVERMLRHGMPVDVTDWGDLTALHSATWSNQIDVVKQLLHEGADVNRQTGDSKDTPLHKTARSNYIEVARLLTDNGADINILNDDNKIPLDIARKGSEVERLLLQLQQSAP